MTVQQFITAPFSSAVMPLTRHEKKCFKCLREAWKMQKNQKTNEWDLFIYKTVYSKISELTMTHTWEYWCSGAQHLHLLVSSQQRLWEEKKTFKSTLSQGKKADVEVWTTVRHKTQHHQLLLNYYQYSTMYAKHLIKAIIHYRYNIILCTGGSSQSCHVCKATGLVKNIKALSQSDSARSWNRPLATLAWFYQACMNHQLKILN